MAGIINGPYQSLLETEDAWRCCSLYFFLLTVFYATSNNQCCTAMGSAVRAIFCTYRIFPEVLG